MICSALDTIYLFLYHSLALDKVIWTLFQVNLIRWVIIINKVLRFRYLRGKITWIPSDAVYENVKDKQTLLFTHIFKDFSFLNNQTIDETNGLHYVK